MTHENPITSQISEMYYTTLFEALDGNIVLMQNDPPRYTILAATPSYLQLTGRTKNDVVGKGFFEDFPITTNSTHTTESGLFLSYQHVSLHKELHVLPVYRFDCRNADGSFTEKYCKVSNKPLRSADGDVLYIVHTSEDITDQIKAEKRLDSLKGLENAYNFFMAAPVIVGFIKGDDYVIELANEGLLEVWGRGTEVIGKPMFAAIPELTQQGFKELLDQVRDTGESFSATEFPISLDRHGSQQVLYFDFVYKPFYENEKVGKADGIISVGYDVTEKVIARQKILESEAKYRMLFESMDEGFCVLKMIFDEAHQPVDYRFLETNPVFEKQSGLKEAVGKTARQLVPGLEAGWFQVYGNVAITGNPVRFTQGSAPMGRWFDVYAFRVGDSNNNEVAVLFTDITERKKGEEIIKQSESNLRNIIHAAPVAMLILSGEDMIVDSINERMTQMIGKSTTLLNKPLLESVPELKGQAAYESFLTVYRTGKAVYGNEILVPLMHNSVLQERYFNFAYTPILENGAVVGVMDVATEVTEQVIARQKVEEANQELRFAIDAMPQMVWVTKPDGYHDVFNKQWYEYTGLSLDETKGTGWNSVVHPDDLERTRNIWKHSLTTGEPYQIEYRLKRFDGEFRWFLGRALPLKDAAGAISKWYGTCTDIDDQRKQANILEEKVAERTLELQNTNRELARSNRNLEEFAHAASHDLKEPVRKINFFTTQLKDQLSAQLHEGQAKAFNRIENATERMRALIDDLLLYSHVTNRPREMESIDLNEKVLRVMEDLELDIEKKGAVVEVTTLPIIKGYRRQLQQLFQNLLSNALKYSKADVMPRIIIKGVSVTENGKPYHLITIHDNGIGFEQQYANKIFQMFTRLHGRNEYSGTGVGLSIVQKVVENHQGFIKVESTPGEGSTFFVYLPIV